MTTVLITGANRGVGLALVRTYLDQGAEVVGVIRHPEAAAEVQKCAAAAKGQLTLLGADVTDEVALAAAARTLGNRPVDIVICNAGVMSNRGGIEAPDNDAADWNRVLTTNVLGVYLAARAFMPHLRRAQGGKLALMSSMMASSALAAGNALGYRASKAAVANLGANLAVELKPAGIAVGIYHPGWVSSDMGGASAPVTPEASAKGLADRIGKLSLQTTGVFEDYLGKPYAF
jgi:NAD(P)-dependent dehydrogenase (short-subunit alcohol dehydrogenase family)